MHVTKAQGSEHVFGRALRSYQTGGITLDDLLGQIDGLLASGASAAELLESLSQREQVEPLPAAVHAALLAHITPPAPAPLVAAMIGPASPQTSSGTAPAAPATSDPAIAAEASTVVLGEDRMDRLAAVPDTAGAELLDGRYRLLEMLADGDLSRVYKAEDISVAPEQRRCFAIKVFKRPVGADGLSMAAVDAEFARLRDLSHPNIVRLFACGRVGSTLYVSMEYLAGETLYARLHSAPHAADHAAARALPAVEVVAIVAGIAAALDHAHAHHVVHGDLKPGNVLLTSTGVKVIDFGFLSRPGALALTPRYASPQLLAQQTPHPADDVYSLACVAYEALSGRQPFGAADGLGVRVAPPPWPEFTPVQYAALLRGLNPERAGRPQTAQAFLREFSQDATAAAVPGAAPVSATSAAVVATPPRGPRAWLALAVLAVLALGGGGLLYSKHGKSPPPVALAPAPAPVPVPARGPDLPVAPAAAPRPAAPGVSPHPTLRDCAACPVMMVLPPGRFRQGVPDEDRNGLAAERPQHVVVLAHPLAVAANDVTVGEYAAFVAATHRAVRGCDVYDGDWRRRNGASFREPGYPQTDAHPVTCVSWNDALAYTQWLRGQSGQPYRLPSAAEWEYAARGGGSASMPWDAGGANACANANVADESAGQRYPGWITFGCQDGFVYTSPVGAFPANDYGLRDMLGNVLQWTQDCWHADYAGARGDGTARLDGDCRDRELRGGSWFSAPPVVRASHRNHFAADYRTSSVGFRVVRDVQP